MPRVWSAAETRRSILRVAAPLATAAASWDSRVSKVRLRCDARQEGQPDERAFVGEADATALAATPQDSTGASSEKVFASHWWEPALAAAGEPEPAHGAP
jgi:hypothetical protein